MQYTIATAIAAIFVISTVNAAPVSDVPASNVTVTKAVPTGGKLSTGIYGRAKGIASTTAKCPDNTFITAISATVTYGINSMAFQCSDGSLVGCFGSCNKTLTSGTPVNTSLPVGISNKYAPQVYSVVSSNGFDNMWINADDNVMGLKTFVNNIERKIVSDQPSPLTGHWYRFPTQDDSTVAGNGNRIVLSGVAYTLNIDIASIQPIYVSTTSVDPDAVPKPAPVKPSPTIKLSPAVANVYSKSVFGHNDKKAVSWSCPGDMWIFSMQAAMTDQIHALKFKCSDNATESPCFGDTTSCDSLPDLQFSSTMSVIDSKHAAKMEMIAPYGFHSLDVYSGARVTQLKSKDAVDGKTLMADTPVSMSGAWGNWPSADMEKYPGDKVLTGMTVRSDSDINQLQPIFRILETTSTK